MSDTAHHPESLPPPRRNFLVKFFTMLIGAVISFVPLVVGLTMYLDPLSRRKSKADSGEAEGEFIPITTLDAIPADGSPQAFPVIDDKVNAWTMTPNERIGAIYLRRPDGGREVIALHTICPHLGCFVGFDDTQDVFYCPCHASSFLLSGAKVAQPGLENPSPRAMDTLEVKVTDQDQVLVRFVNFKTGLEEKEVK
jgi:menaquinol-cytochrome c reductase iron-sulfur subunit